MSVEGLAAIPASPRIRTAAALLPILLGLVFAARHFSMMLNPESLAVPFTDAITYLAAGERLNAGHDLYRLVDGDRQVLVLPWVSNAALLSPPPIAVIWRPIAALPFGYVAWLAACWSALLGTVFVLARRTGWAGVLIAAGLAPAIGEQLAAGNLASFFPGMLVLAWRCRGTSSAGLIIGAMASLKLAPIAIGGWLIGTRNWPGVAAAAATVVLATMVSILGAGIGSLAQYISVAGTAAPSTTSLSALTGIPVLSPALLLAGSLIAVLIGRWPAVSFAVGVVASVLGTPALYISGYATLLAVLAPLAYPGKRGPAPVGPGRMPLRFRRGIQEQPA